MDAIKPPEHVHHDTFQSALEYANNGRDTVSLLSDRMDWLSFDGKTWLTEKTTSLCVDVTLDVERQWLVNQIDGSGSTSEQDGSGSTPEQKCSCACEVKQYDGCAHCGAMNIRWTYKELLGHAAIAQDDSKLKNLTIRFKSIDGDIIDNGVGATLKVEVQTKKEKREETQGQSTSSASGGQTVPVVGRQPSVQVGQTVTGGGSQPDVQAQQDKREGRVIKHVEHSIVTSARPTPSIRRVDPDQHVVLGTSSGYCIPTQVPISSGHAEWFFHGAKELMAMPCGGDGSIDWICVKLPTKGNDLSSRESSILSHFRKLWEIALVKYPRMACDEHGKPPDEYASVVLIKTQGSDGVDTGGSLYARVPYIRGESAQVMAISAHIQPDMEILEDSDELVMKISDKCHGIRTQIPAGTTLQSHFKLNMIVPMLTLTMQLRWTVSEESSRIGGLVAPVPMRPKKQGGGGG